MSDQRLIVLKFGGPVLADEAALADAAHEVYRWRREGWGVVAVASAFNGTTDRLLAKVELLCPDPSPESLAAIVSLGEAETAAALGAALDRAGLTATVLTPGAIRLIGQGPPDDAAPVDIDQRIIREALNRDGVAVVPGFTGQAEDGRPVLFGRGGSDLTALFIASQLGARCRLVKDVDALYERDPKSPGPAPARFAEATYEDVLALDSGVIQPKAVRFARSLDLRFELTSLNGTTPTRIGEPRSQLLPPVASSGREPVRVALLGFGAVGQGVFHHLQRLEPDVQVVSVALRDPDKPRDIDPPAELVTTDLLAAAAVGADIVIEALGGLSPAREAAIAAIRSGASLVTANKALLAEHWDELHDLADQRGGAVLGSASVGGGVPVVEALTSRPGRSVRRVRGVLNGTTNFVLERIAAGDAFENAIEEARRRGYAEADPSGDLDGHDAANKLAIIARTLGARLTPGDIERDSFTPDALAAARAPARSGEPDGAVRQIATLDLTGPTPRAEVRLRAVPVGDGLHRVPGERNAAAIEWDDGVTTLLRGRGAGRWPTAEAVLADVLALLRQRAGSTADAEGGPLRERSLTHA